MSATEREPFRVRQQEAETLARALTSARSELACKEEGLADLRTRIDRILRPDPRRVRRGLVLGIIALPLVLASGGLLVGLLLSLR